MSGDATIRRRRAHLGRAYVEIEVPIPVGHVNIGRWQIIVEFDHWRRGRGAWPTTWHALPRVDGVSAPIFRWWALGPLQVRRYRWREG